MKILGNDLRHRTIPAILSASYRLGNKTKKGFDFHYFAKISFLITLLGNIILSEQTYSRGIFEQLNQADSVSSVFALTSSLGADFMMATAPMGAATKMNSTAIVSILSA